MARYISKSMKCSLVILTAEILGCLFSSPQNLLSQFSNSAVRFHRVLPETIEMRLDRAVRKNSERQKILLELFEQAGCTGERLTEQPVRREKVPNVVCILPGSTNATIVVGAHFDHTSAGMGVIDNWSGAALLPSLFESLSHEPRKHTYVFVGFTGEEKGLIGSSFYVQQITPTQAARIEAMVNLDSLGLGPTKIWLSRSDGGLAAGLQATANAIKLPLQAINADQVGDEDSRPFRDREIRTVVLHSITQETLPILHSAKDNKAAVKMNDYVGSYRLIAAYLAFLDTALPANQN